MDKYSQNKKSVKKDAKQEQLDQYRKSNEGKPLTTQEGRKISNDSETLKAGVRGPSLHEDYWFLEKMSHFVHEEIPERVVHARGYGA